MAWKFNGRDPVFLQIANRLRRDIVDGKYPPACQFPSVRQIAADAAVNPNTVQKALSYLEDEGILLTRGTIGRFVTEDVAILTEAKQRILRDSARRWLEEADELGISPSELIELIKKEAFQDGHTDS